ncbi:hypothetical protein [Paenibacillus bouchesdurhonensis]|uniref:hypothetical protein n=1 Tax=Paenibacillus bouchesdurhonensis TaxID=1870990 RepID=UPI000DA5EF71|nr:hypothetical protein [Paenibacillus bouchesdurhonensis]
MVLSSINKVLIIDDQIEEALPIMKALSTKGVYSLFWDGKVKNKPEVPLNDVRLVILDMRFSTVTDSHTINSTLFGYLISAISSDNGPYILCMWSKHNNEYLSLFKEEIKKQSRVPQPYLITSLEKKDFINLVDDIYKTTRNQLAATVSNISNPSIEEEIMEIFETLPLYSEHGEVSIDKLLMELDNRLSEMNALSTLLLWEKTVSQASNILVNNVAVLSDTGYNWNKNILNIIQRLAIANAGKSLGSSITTAGYVTNAFASLNQMLPDELWNQMQVLEIDEQQFQYMSDPSITHSIDEDEYSISKINKFIVKKNGRDHISFSKIEDVIQHNDKEIIESLHNKYLHTLGFTNSKLLCQKIMQDDNKKPGKLYLVEDQQTMVDIVFNVFGNTNLNMESIRLVKLDISSSCDYAQNKLKRQRILFGIKVPIAQFIKLNKKFPESLYSTPELLIENELYGIIFSFHHISNDPIGESTGTPVLEFRELFLTDIKHYLSAFISRVGIMRLE